MKRPSIVQALAVINSILVIVMMVEIYRLKNPKPKALPQLQPTAQATPEEPPKTDELLTIILSQSPVQEKLRAIQRLPAELSPEQRDQLFIWATKALPQSGEHNRLEIIDLSDAAYRKLITAGHNPIQLTEFFEQTVDDQTLWLPMRQQALIGLFLLFEKVSQGDSSADKQAVEDSLTRVTNTTLHEDSPSLALTTFEGGLYLEPRVTDNPIRGQLDAYCLTILRTDQPRTMSLKAIDYAKVRNLDISPQAAWLIKNSQDASVAIAAQKFLLDHQKAQTEPQ